MPLCVNCGVELDEGLKICPLCGKDPEDKGDQELRSNHYPSNIIRLHKKENRRYLWELSGIIVFSGIAVSTIVDLLLSKELRWSLYSDVSLATVWVILTLFRFAYKKPVLLTTFLGITLLTALFFIDLLSAGKTWFFPVGLPVTVTLFIVTISIIFFYSKIRLRGLNIVATSLILFSGFCIILEMTLDKYLHDLVVLRWSLIAAISILPVALILFFYHYRLKKGNRLDSFFHI